MKWIICFTKSPNIGIWRLFTLHRPEFGHVFAIRFDPETKVWIYTEFASENFNFWTLKGDDATEMISALHDYCTCIEFEAVENPIHLPKFMYCVAFIKHLVGIGDIRICTPYQLHCELLKRGGKPIFERQIEESADGINIEDAQTAG